jgi:hypothetical protein
LQAEIGFPIRRRPDADTYTVPIKRRNLRPVRPAGTPTATPFAPEPAMAASDYEAALAVLRNSRNALERTPSLAAKLSEEQIRDLLLGTHCGLPHDDGGGVYDLESARVTASAEAQRITYLLLNWVLLMCRKGGIEMSDDLEWFCAECPFDGSEDEVKEHAKQFGHWYAISDWYFMPDFKVTSFGVTGCPLPDGMKPTWIHANFCNTCEVVLNDDEVKDHARSHFAKGE